MLFSQVGAASRHRIGLVSRSCRGLRTGHQRGGFSRNLRDPVSPFRKGWLGAAAPKCTRPPAGVGQRGETKTGARDWYRQAKETKHGGKDDWVSEHLIVPWSRGNRTSGTPGREGDACQGPVGGRHDRGIEPGVRVNATTTDSLQRIPDQKSRMREIRTYGSVGTPGGQPPGVTRLNNSETFRRDPVGRQAHPVELASGRKRVLRRLEATPAGEA